MARDMRGITQFYLLPTLLSTSGMNHTCLYSQAAERHRTFGRYSFSAPLRVEGWVGPLVTNRGGLLAQTVIHPSTNRARHRVTSLTETNALPLSQAATTAHNAVIRYPDNWTRAEARRHTISAVFYLYSPLRRGV